MNARCPTVCTFALSILLTTTDGTFAEDWNQWRGPHRDGLDLNSPALITALPAGGLAPLWLSDDEIPTGGSGGWSCPVVADGRVYVFAHVKQRREGVELPPAKFPKLEDDARDQLTDEAFDAYEANRRTEQQQRRELQYNYQERLTCFAADTGQQQWVNESASRPTRFPQSATPAIVAGVAFVHGARGTVRAIDAASGKNIWQLQLPGEFDDEPHAASVAVADGVVIIVADRLHGIDAKSGKLRWQGEDEIRSDHASCAIWQHNDQAYVLAHLGNETACFAAATGREQWRVESQAGRSSPVVVGDHLITYGNSRKGGVRCFAMTADGAELLWTNTAVADEGSSPVVVAGHAYVHGDRRLVCIDMASGKTRWRRELDIERPRYTSLIAADNQVLFAAGGLLTFAADPQEYRLLINGRIDRAGHLGSVEFFREQLEIDDLERTAEGQKQAESLWRKQITSNGPAQCISPAIANGRLYLRLKQGRVACYDLRKSK